MKRLFLFAAVLILGSTWASTARAQYGFGGFGGSSDVNSEIDAERSKIKQQLNRYAKPQSRPSRATAVRGGPGAADRYGRVDLAGHPIAGYPIIRGDLGGPSGARVSRGGANGKGRRGRRAR